MFKPVSAKTVTDYIRSLPHNRRNDIERLHAFIKKSVPKLTPYFANNMIGYGRFPYLNYKKEAIDWPIIALASQKKYISIYICSIEDGQYLAERYKNDLGRVNVGKSCIRFTSPDDLSMASLRRILRIAEKKPGITKK